MTEADESQQDLHSIRIGYQ